MQASNSEGTQVYSGRLGVQQRVLPVYRAPFFDTLAPVCRGGLSVFAGLPLPEENTPPAARLEVAELVPAQNRNYFRVSSPLYQCRQEGILDWLDRWQPDALIVEANPRTLTTLDAVAWMHARGRPVLGWGLGAPPLQGVLAPWRRLNRLTLLRSLDGMIAYSRRGAGEYQTLGFPAGRVFVAPNAAAHRPTQPPPERPLEYPDGQPVVLFVGRLQPRKRVDTLLRACAALPPALQPKVWIVGDGPARAEFEAVAQGTYPHTEFTGDLRGLALEARFKAADLFVLPGTGGLAVQEAMAYALPVIVAEGDGTQEDLVRSPQAGLPANGWQVPPGNLPALAETLRAALADPSRLRQMGLEAYRTVRDEVNLESMAAAFVRALQRVERI